MASQQQRANQQQATTRGGRSSGIVDPANNFTQFRALPRILRTRIWESIVSQSDPRYIRLRINRNNNTLYSRARIPALIQTCRESRIIALKHYKLCFGTNSRHLQGTDSNPKVYFDAEREGLYLPCSQFRGNCGIDLISSNTRRFQDLEKVQKILWEGPLVHNPMERVMVRFPGCKELFLVKRIRMWPKTERVLLNNAEEDLQELFPEQFPEEDRGQAGRTLQELLAEGLNDMRMFAVEGGRLEEVTRLKGPRSDIPLQFGESICECGLRNDDEGMGDLRYWGTGEGNPQWIW